MSRPMQQAECPRPDDRQSYRPPAFDLSTPEDEGAVIDLLDPALEDHPEAWTW